MFYLISYDVLKTETNDNQAIYDKIDAARKDFETVQILKSQYIIRITIPIHELYERLCRDMNGRDKEYLNLLITPIDPARCASSDRVRGILKDFTR